MPALRTIWLLFLLMNPRISAATEPEPLRPVTLTVNLGEKQPPLDIDKLASLGQGGQSEDPIWEGRAAEVRALHPRIIRLFLQEYFDVLPAKGEYHFKTMDALVLPAAAALSR
jgi:hypothetical protein